MLLLPKGFGSGNVPAHLLRQECRAVEPSRILVPAEAGEIPDGLIPRSGVSAGPGLEVLSRGCSLWLKDPQIPLEWLCWVWELLGKADLSLKGWRMRNAPRAWDSGGHTSRAVSPAVFEGQL